MPRKGKTPPTFSNQLRAAMKATGKSASAIANEAGISRAVLTRFVSGSRGLQTATLDRLIASLGLELRTKEE